MGLIKNALNSIGNAVKDVGTGAGGALLGGFGGVLNQAMYQEYFTSGSMAGDIIMKRAEQVQSNGSTNNKSDANVISNGSMIDVQSNQCMIIVENGKVVEACMEPGRFTYDTSIAPSFFAGEGKFGEKIKNVAVEMWEQAKVGGQRRNTQRIYFINMGVLDKSLNWGVGRVQFQHTEKLVTGAPLSIGVTLKGYGTAAVRIERPLDFYENYGAKFAGGDNDGVVTLDSLETFFTRSKHRVTESIATAITELGSTKAVRYNEIMSTENKKLLKELVNTGMEDTDLSRIGFDFYEFSVGDGGFILNEGDFEKIQNLQLRASEVSDINMANYTIQSKMAEGFQKAGENGGVSGLVGMGMAMGGGMSHLGNIQRQSNQFNQPNQHMPAADSWTCSCGATAIGKFCNNCGTKKPEPKAADSWACSCGANATGKFCPECGAKKPEAPVTNGWTCSCGHVNKGKFCQECGAKKPTGAPLYRCDRCGWEPEDPKNPPKFCPECGDRFDENDIQQ